MANTYTTSKIVNLYDVTNSGTLLEPATELRAVTINSGGLVQVSGNSIWVDPADIGSVGGYALKSEVGSLAYTSLTEPSESGGSIGSAGTSTGTGVIVSQIDTTTNVRTPYTSASNDLIPTERAVAFGLDKKQDYLISGNGIVIAPDANNRPVISADLVQVISGGTFAELYKIPSAQAVRYSLDSAMNQINITMSSYATSAWCLNTFYQKGETPAGSGDEVPFANYTTAGKVMPIQSEGLIIGAGGSMTVQSAGVYATLASAAAAPHGAVRVVNSITSDAEYANVAYVPHVNAVSAHVSNALTGYVKTTDSATVGSAGIVQLGSGVTATNGVLTLENATTSSIGGIIVGSGLGVTSSGKVSLSQATSSTIGGVLVGTGLDVSSGRISTKIATSTGFGIATYPASKGLIIANGSVTLSAAPTTSDISQASAWCSAGRYGGVVCLDRFADSPTAPLYDKAVVPTVSALINTYGSNNQFVKLSNTVQPTASRAICAHSGGLVFNTSGVLIQELTSKTVNVGVGSASRFSYVHVTSENDVWSATYSAGSRLPEDSTGHFYVPILYAVWSSDTVTGSQTAETYQMHTGPIVVGYDTKATAGGSQSSNTVLPYRGPFAASATASNGNTLTTTVSGGYINTPGGRVECASSAGITMSEGYVLYLYGSSGTYDSAGASKADPVTTSYLLETSTMLPSAAADESYTRIAINSGGTMVQVQFGDVINNNWGNDYKNVFAISRVPLASDQQLTGYQKNRYIITSGGSVYGCDPFNSEGSGTILSYPADATQYESSHAADKQMQYPMQVISGTTVNNGLYLTGEMASPVWLNIWSGTWPEAAGGWFTPTDSKMRFIVDTKCYEVDPPVSGSSSLISPNVYSVQLGYVNPNGASVQIQKGAIEIRGRWS